MEFSQNLYKVKYELKYAMKTYSMEYYFETKSGGTCNISFQSFCLPWQTFPSFYIFIWVLVGTGKVADWTCTLHDLQLCFGVREFLVCLNLSSCLLFGTI